MDHLKYYKIINSIPVVDLLNLPRKEIDQQRKKFFFNLGLTINNFKDREALEVCAGTGYNAIFMLKTFKLKKITCLDNNPASIKSIKKNLIKIKNKKIINKNLYQFKSKKKFDFVIMENALDNFKNQKNIIKKLTSLTKKNGNILLTIGDNVGILSTKLRYILSLILVEQNKLINFNTKKFFLSNIFKSHLAYLSKKTRKSTKWVLDNLINSEWIRKKNYIDYNYLIKNLNKNVLIENISPSFHKNYKWYKTLDFKTINRDYLKSYNNDKINFLDFETRFKINFNIENNLKKIYNEIYKLKPEKKINKKIIINIEIEIAKIIKKIKVKNKVYFALLEFMNILKDYRDNKKINTKIKYLKKFWGVYSQNVLLYKS